MFNVSGILFNHESERRGIEFVTRKISKAVSRIHYKIQNKLSLGNLEASRDWGFAGDYVEAMWLMMQHEVADDWVVATGETYTVRDFAKAAFDYANLNYEDYVVTSEKYLRPNEVNHLLGDPSKAKQYLGWEPETSFQELVKLMVQSDLKLAEREKTLIENNLLDPTWEYST